MLQKEEKRQCQYQKKFFCLTKFDSQRSLKFLRALGLTLIFFSLVSLKVGLLGWRLQHNMLQGYLPVPAQPFSLPAFQPHVLALYWAAGRRNGAGERMGEVQAGMTSASATLELSGEVSSAQHRL